MSSADLVEAVARFAREPLGFVRGAYDWGAGELRGADGPRAWQSDILARIGEHLRGAQRYEPLKIAVASGHGVGKSALMGQLCAWAMSTCDDCRVVLTAGTGRQLETKTAPEVAKWFRRAITARWFAVQSQSIYALAKGHERTWRADYVTWSEENTEAFAGLHNAGKRIVVIYDEASAISDRIWDVTEGALTDEGTEIIWLAFGNPTLNTGRFRECFGAQKHRWQTTQLDSRTVEGTNKAQIQKWIEDYGEDSDFVRVRVRGEFPRAGSDQFIPSDAVAVCRKFNALGQEHAPGILGVDVARFGDDRTVLMYRRGREAKIAGQYRGLDTMQTADKVVSAIAELELDAVVVDGDGLGAGVVDRLKQLGYGRLVTEFHGGVPAHDTHQYFNRRAEVWGLMRDALKNGMAVPDLPDMEQDLCGIQYGFSGKEQIQLEAKADMKKRGLASPDLGDALAMTFAVRPAAKQRNEDRFARYEYMTNTASALSWMG